VTCPATGKFYSSAWLGLGGDVSGDKLFQTGTGSDCLAGNAVYNAWWESVPGNGEQDYPDTVLPGDHMRALVSWYAYDNSSVQMELLDFGQTWPSYAAPQAQWTEEAYAPTTTTSVYGAKSIECIVERPQLRGSLTRLANFGSTHFNRVNGTPWSLPGCQTEQSTYGEYRLAQASTVPGPGATISALNMVNDAGQTLASTTSPSTTGAFAVTWRRSG
jgi:hypothetical protein